MTPGCGDAADPSARCCRARPIIGHRQDQLQASLSDYADERADQPYMRAAASSARERNLRRAARRAGARSWPNQQKATLSGAAMRPDSRLFAALIHLSSAPRQAQIAVICVPRLASAEQQRIARDGDLVWAGVRTRRGQRPGPWWARPCSRTRRRRPGGRAACWRHPLQR
jgi:hypothetical protein